MKKERWIVTEGIAGIASKDEVVIVDPANPGILVSRWLGWSEYPRLVKHLTSLFSLDGPPLPLQPHRPGRRHLGLVS